MPKSEDLLREIKGLLYIPLELTKVKVFTFVSLFVAFMVLFSWFFQITGKSNTNYFGLDIFVYPISFCLSLVFGIYGLITLKLKKINHNILNLLICILILYIVVLTNILIHLHESKPFGLLFSGWVGLAGGLIVSFLLEKRIYIIIIWVLSLFNLFFAFWYYIGWDYVYKAEWMPIPLKASSLYILYCVYYTLIFAMLFFQKVFFERILNMLSDVVSKITIIEEKKYYKELELEAGKEIQQAALPKKNFLLNRDIRYDVFIRPYYKVSGDFCDIVETESKIFIGIGDATGHGVRAGIIMLMAKAAFRSVIYNSPNVKITKLLSTINDVIYSMNYDCDVKVTMSLALMVYEDGKIIVTGNHESLIVYKKDHGLKIIHLEKMGINVGLLPDINICPETKTFYLGKEDTLLLYTDGATELENLDGDPIGDDVLASIFIGSCECFEFSEILENIVKNLSIWSKGNFTDDILLFIFKRN